MRGIYGLLAEFDDPQLLIEAARRSAQLGYRRMDAYTPYPIEELNESVSPGRSPIPAIMLVGALAAGAAAYGLMWYSAVVDYPWNVGGRPLHSWPSFVPITFELTILGGALCAFLAVIVLCRLPRLHHPLFNVPRFRRASRDRYFLCIRADDDRFDHALTRALLEGAGARSVQEVPW